MRYRAYAGTKLVDSDDFFGELIARVQHLSGPIRVDCDTYGADGVSIPTTRTVCWVHTGGHVEYVD